LIEFSDDSADFEFNAAKAPRLRAAGLLHASSPLKSSTIIIKGYLNENTSRGGYGCLATCQPAFMVRKSNY
jgi:hypothetical protein